MDVEYAELMCLNSKIMKLNKHLESFQRKKKRNNWCKFGDRNIRFFQLSAFLTNKRNFIDTKVIGGNGISSPLEIKFQATTFISDQYKSIIIDRSYVKGIRFKILSNDSLTWLQREITLEEVKGAMWSCDRSKALRPDGLNFNFYIYIKKHDLERRSFTVLQEIA